MKVIRVLIIIIVLSAGLVSCKKVDLADDTNEEITVTNAVENKEYNGTILERKEENLTDFNMGAGQVSGTEGMNFELDIIMKDGYHYWEEEPSPFYGDNYIGQYEMILKKDGIVVDEYDLSQDWEERYNEEMRFSRTFEIELIDYDNDGNYEFLMGQYFSSNLNIYHMYQINTTTNEIAAMSDMGFFNMSGKRETERLKQEDDGNYYIQGYDNSESKYFRIPIIFKDGLAEKGEVEYFDSLLSMLW